MAGLKLPVSQDGILTLQFVSLHCRGSSISSILLPAEKLNSSVTIHLDSSEPSDLSAYSREPNKLVCCISGAGKKLINLTSKIKYHIRPYRTPQHVNLNRWNQVRISAPGLLQVSANSKADDPVPSEMSLEVALNLLGVGEGASFEEILIAKNVLLARASEDQDLAIKVESAYDLLLMQSLMRRKAGKVVDNSILYADVKKAKSGSSFFGGNAEPDWAKESFDKFPVKVESPPVSSVGLQTAVYSALAIWNFASGLSSSPGGVSVNTHADVPGLILAIGFGASICFLRKKSIKLGKAAAITVAGVAAGSVFGGAVESWLQVDLVPVFGIGSPAVVVSEFVLISLWLSSLYLH